MLVFIILLSSGLSLPIEVGDSCIDALHSLRSEQMMQIVSTEALDGVLIYNLTEDDSAHYMFHTKPKAKKTAILGCHMPLSTPAPA